MRETEFQQKCLKWIDKHYRNKLIAVNIHGDGFTNKGFPDLIVFGKDKAIVVELKCDSGYQMQDDQIIWRNRFNKIGIHHFKISDFNSFQKTIEEEFPNEN